MRTERNNFKAMYENAKDRKEIKRLQTQVWKLQKELALRDEIIILLQEQNETLKLRVDELERMVFWKHKRKDKDPPTGSGWSDWENWNINNLKSDTNIPKTTKRPPFSYRRKTPEEKNITDTKIHSIPECPDCGNALKKLKIAERFIEDMPSLSEIQKLLHQITKHSIETGYCPCCKKRKIAIPIPKHLVSIWDNIRRFVCYCSVIQNQTYSQIKQFLSDMAGIHLSDWEITDIFESEKMKMIPEYVAIKERLEKEKVVHFDETPWYVAKEEQWNYWWLKTWVHKTSEMLFSLGRSRGKGNAEELLGKPSNAIIGGQIGISDDYGAYKKIFEIHWLCWAHPLRKFRDLKESPSLTVEQIPRCQNTYESFAKLYSELNKILEEENNYHKDNWEWRAEKILKKEKKLRKAFKKLSIIHQKDPKKLKTLKTSLQKNEDAYFVCMSWPGIPSDNNKAERWLRHIVLKRKVSYWSKTQKWADVFSVLASVLLSLKAKYPLTFFREYHNLMESL